MASSNSNKTSVPEAKSAMNKFKMEVAKEILRMATMEI